MQKEGVLFKGVLYAGLMLTDKGPKVLEYNVRFGDPETQPLMMLLSSDLYGIVTAVINTRLTKKNIRFRSGSALCVVLTAKGYPGQYRKGDKINGLGKIRGLDIQIFHAGTRKEGRQIVTNGGRVLGITAFGRNLSDARVKAYHIISSRGVNFRGMHYRTDIAINNSQKKLLPTEGF